MKVSRWIAGPASSENVQALAALGVTVAEGGWFGFWIEEADSRWPEIQAWRARKGWHDEPLAETKFTATELATAKWLELSSEWVSGYPQPDSDSFGYLKVTYDDSGSCARCGIGLRQVAPFRMRGEPKWGSRGLLHLNWVFDALFTTPQIWNDVFRPAGIESMVVHDSGGQPLKTVVQLVIEETVELDMTGMHPSICDSCGVAKYQPVTRGFFPPLVGEPTHSMSKLHQWFGSGGQAFQALLMSNEVSRALSDAKVKGVRRVPVPATRPVPSGA
jgi:hypothetical protein